MKGSAWFAGCLSLFLGACHRGPDYCDGAHCGCYGRPACEISCGLPGCEIDCASADRCEVACHDGCELDCNDIALCESSCGDDCEIGCFRATQCDFECG